jgi:cell wall-associated NlpC family hydrolase
MSWTRTRAAAACAALAVVVATLVTPSGAAQADPDLTHARAAAAALALKVDRLNGQLEAATEDYGAAATALNDVVTRMLTADQGVDDANIAAAAATARTDDAARQMYMSGGPGAIYASILEGRSIGDVLDRIASVDSVVRGDVIATSTARVQATSAAATRARYALLTTRRRVLEGRLAAAADRARLIHAQTQAALASATSLVLRLVDQERAAQQAAAEAAARAAAGVLPWGSASVPADAYAALDRAIAEATAAPATPYAVGALTDARRWLGTPYSAGGGNLDGPTTGWCSSSAPDDGRTQDGTCAAEVTVGFDCSSLMVRIFHAAGRALPRTSRQQWTIGVHVPLAALAPGDLLFWANDLSRPGSIHHVAMYIGHGLMVQAPHTGGHVEVAPVYLRGLIGAVRPT